MVLLLPLLAGHTGAQSRPLLAPSHVRETGRLTDRALGESSGVTRGRVNPGVLWTINDSGNDPALFAVDTLGRVAAVVLLHHATNVDWEALGSGPCGADFCLYVGDVGDNMGQRSSLVIYRVVEPKLGAGQPGAGRIRDSMVVKLAGGARDIESLVVTPTEDVALISKGWREAPNVFWIPKAAWSRLGVTAAVVDTIATPRGWFRSTLVTDAALSPDGSRLVIRSYREVFVFKRGPRTRFLPDEPEASCDIRGREPQGEGVAWWDANTLLLTSERSMGRDGTILLLQCNAP